MKNKRTNSVSKEYSAMFFYVSHSPESQQRNGQTFMYYISQPAAIFKTKSPLTGIIICGDFNEAGRPLLAVQQEGETAGACLYQGKKCTGFDHL